MRKRSRAKVSHTKIYLTKENFKGFAVCCYWPYLGYRSLLELIEHVVWHVVQSGEIASATTALHVEKSLTHSRYWGVHVCFGWIWLDLIHSFDGFISAEKLMNTNSSVIQSIIIYVLVNKMKLGMYIMVVKSSSKHVYSTVKHSRCTVFNEMDFGRKITALDQLYWHAVCF